jgi:hypothetical protein
MRRSISLVSLSAGAIASLLFARKLPSKASAEDAAPAATASPPVRTTRSL